MEIIQKSILNLFIIYIFLKQSIGFLVCVHNTHGSNYLKVAMNTNMRQLLNANEMLYKYNTNDQFIEHVSKIDWDKLPSKSFFF